MNRTAFDVARLSAHFTLDELCFSHAAVRNDIDTAPTTTVLANLTHLAREVLDPIRNAAGLPIVVSSGYRPPRLNALVGGSANSDHLYGRAADIRALGRDVGWLLQVIRGLPHLPLKQCIVEFSSWIHVSIDLSDFPRREFLSARREGGKTVYRALA